MSIIDQIRNSGSIEAACDVMTRYANTPDGWADVAAAFCVINKDCAKVAISYDKATKKARFFPAR